MRNLARFATAWVKSLVLCVNQSSVLAKAERSAEYWSVHLQYKEIMKPIHDPPASSGGR